MTSSDSRNGRIRTRDDLRLRSSPPAKVGDNVIRRGDAPSTTADGDLRARTEPGSRNGTSAATGEVARAITLQQSAGNQAVGGLLRRASAASTRDGPAPNVAGGTDALELEADRKADLIAARWGAGFGDARDDETPPRDAGDGVPIPPGLRRAAEPVLGESFGDVRLHTGSPAASWTSALDAMALTVGRDIYFPRQHLRLAAFESRHLLAHELAHTAQQSSFGAAFVQCGPPKKGTKRGAKKAKKKPVKVLRVTFYVDRDKVLFYLEGDKVIVLDTDYNGHPRAGSFIIRRKNNENIPTERVGGTPNEKGWVVEWTEPPETPFVYADSYQFGIRTGRASGSGTGVGEGGLGDASSMGSGAGASGHGKEGDKKGGEAEKAGTGTGATGGVEGSAGAGTEGAAGKSSGAGAGEKDGLTGGGGAGGAGGKADPNRRRLTPREEALWRDLYEKMTGAPPGSIDDPLELIRLYEILRERVRDPKFSTKGEPWTEFAKFLDKNRDKIEGIIQSGPGKLTAEKMEQIIEEYGKFIAGERDQDSGKELKTLDDFDKEFQYDPGWAQLSRADRRLLLEYAKLTPDQVGTRKVEFSRITTSMKIVMALKASWKSWPGEIADAAKKAFTDPAFIITLVVMMAIYVGLWLTPDPSLVTKIAAGTLTVTLLLQFAWEDIYGLAVAWSDLSDACAAATTMPELQAAGDRFAKKVGQVGFDIICFIVMGRIAKRVGPKVQKVATERLIANAEAQVATAEAKPGSGVKPPETVESRTALNDAKAKAASDTPAATLDALQKSLPEPARDGLAALRKAQGDTKALAEVEAEVAAGHDLAHALTERGMSEKANATVREEVATANEAVAQAEAKLEVAKSKADAATAENAAAARAEAAAAAGELAKARGKLTAAEAKPGSGVSKAAPATKGPTLLETAKAAAKAQTPTAVLDALASKLPKGARDGLAAFRKTVADANVLRALEAESAKGFDITRFLVEKGTTPAERAAATADLLAAEAKLARAEMIKAETFKDPSVRAEARANAIRRLKARLHEAGILDNPKVAKAMKGGDVTELRGAIGEALGRTQLAAEYPASGGYRILANIGVAREIPGFKTIAEWQAAEIKAGRTGDTSKLVQHKGKVYEMIGEVDSLVVQMGKGKKLRVVAAEEVKSGAETAASAKGQVEKAIEGLADIQAGAKDVKVFERPGKQKFGKELTDSLDLSSLGEAKQLARGPKGREGYESRQLGYSTEVLQEVATNIVKEGLPPKGPKKVVPQAWPKGKNEDEDEPTTQEESKEPAGAAR